MTSEIKDLIQKNYYLDYLNLNESDLGAKHEKVKFYIFKKKGSLQENVICSVSYEVNTRREEELTSFSGLTDKHTTETFTTTEVEVFTKTFKIIRGREFFTPPQISKQEFIRNICEMLETEIKLLIKK